MIANRPLLSEGKEHDLKPESRATLWPKAWTMVSTSWRAKIQYECFLLYVQRRDFTRKYRSTPKVSKPKQKEGELFWLLILFEITLAFYYIIAFISRKFLEIISLQGQLNASRNSITCNHLPKIPKGQLEIQNKLMHKLWHQRSFHELNFYKRLYFARYI